MSLESVEDCSVGLRFADGLTAPLWDTASAEIEVWQDNRGHECAYGQVVDGHPWMRVVGIGDFRLDSDRGAIVVPDEGVSRSDVIDTYYRTVLPMAMQLAGREVLHASAVVMPQGVLALCAVSETGKSTLAYGMTRLGHQLYADDAVAFEVSGSQPVLTQIPFALRLRQQSADHFGEPSRNLVRVKGSEKDSMSGTSVQERSLAAICVLERQEGEQAAKQAMGTAEDRNRVAAVERLSPAAGFAAILPHAYCFSLRDANRKKLMMQHYMSLARLTPVLCLRFISGLGNIPEILETLESALYRHCPESRAEPPHPQMREKFTVR